MAPLTPAQQIKCRLRIMPIFGLCRWWCEGAGGGRGWAWKFGITTGFRGRRGGRRGLCNVPGWCGVGRFALHQKIIQASSAQIRRHAAHPNRVFQRPPRSDWRRAEEEDRITTDPPATPVTSTPTNTFFRTVDNNKLISERWHHGRPDSRCVAQV